VKGPGKARKQTYFTANFIAKKMVLHLSDQKKFEAQTIINKTDIEETKLLAKTTCKVSLKCPIKISINFIRSIRFSQFFIII
jgi:hypothetical protein